jgi:hypothetical protein
MNIAIVNAVIRHLLTAFGGIAVAKGYVDSATLETVVGAILTLICFGWSLADKKKNAA